MSGRGNTAHLTKEFVDGLAYPNSGQVFYRDSKLPGFAVRITPGAKSYVVESWVVDPISGKGKSSRVTVGKHGKLTAEEARKIAKKQLGRQSAGEDLNAAKRSSRKQSETLRQLYERYMSIRGYKLSEKTKYCYRNWLEQTVADWWDKPVKSISAEMVSRRHTELSNSGSKWGTGATQANCSMRVLHALMRFADLPTNPVTTLSRNRQWNRAVRRQDIISRADLPKWYRAVLKLEPLYRDFFLLLLFSGLRAGEASSLTRWSLDFNEDSLTIAGSRTKNHQAHVLPLPTFLKELLSRRLQTLQAAGQTSEFVFPNGGKSGHICYGAAAYGTVQAATGIDWSNHTLRRTFLTEADRLDVSHYALKRLANHRTSADVTLGYLVKDLDRLRGPMQQICDSLCKLGQIDIEDIYPSTDIVANPANFANSGDTALQPLFPQKNAKSDLRQSKSAKAANFAKP